MNSIIQLVLKYLPFLIQASASVPRVLGFLAELKVIFARENIWTPEEAAKFDAETEEKRSDPYWKVTD